MRFCVLTLVCALTVACEEPPPDIARGGVGEPSGVPAHMPAPPAVMPPDEAACPPGERLDPGPALVRRLTRLEYDNTVRDLIGVDDALARSTFAPEEESLGFDNNARALQVAPLHAEQFMEASEALSTRVVARFDALHTCEVRDRDCAAAFIRDFGRRAWRRPLDTVEQLRLIAVYDTGAQMEGVPFENGVGLVAQALLQSPHFLYRIELGEPTEVPGLNRLGPFELASRLSYLVWRSMPDDALLDAAAADALGTPDQLAGQLHRLLADERAPDAVWTFFRQWLDLDEIDHVDKDRATFPLWTDALRLELAEESRHFVDHVVWSAGDLRELYLADYAFVDRRLADHYALAPVTGDAFRKVSTGGQRRGVLTQGALMAATSKPNQTSPIHRGILVRERLLCAALPPPPPDVTATPPDPDPSLTTRERFAAHTEDETCRSCHRLIDPIGFGFEHFDALGRWRDTENGLPVDASGEVVQTYDLDGPFDGVTELAQRLAGSEQAQRCVALQTFRYAFGRWESPIDTCTLDALYDAYVDGGHRFDALLEGVVVSDAFRFRRAQADEGVSP